MHGRTSERATAPTHERADGRMAGRTDGWPNQRSDALARGWRAAERADAQRVGRARVVMIVVAIPGPQRSQPHRADHHRI